MEDGISCIYKTPSHRMLYNFIVLLNCITHLLFSAISTTALTVAPPTGFNKGNQIAYNLSILLNITYWPC